MKSNQEKFIRILDKSQIPTCTILNVKKYKKIIGRLYVCSERAYDSDCI